MKKIGIVGGVGWQSTTEYYSELCRRSEQWHLAGNPRGVPTTPEISIESSDLAKAPFASSRCSCQTLGRTFLGGHMKKVSLPPLTANLAAAILGIWKLKSREDVDATEQIHIDPFLGRDPLGILCFAPSHFAAQFMKRDRFRQENVSQPVQAKNNTVAVNGYDAYFGTYSIDEIAGTLTTHLEGSISPANVGGTYVRDVRVVDNELIVQLHTTAVDGTALIRTNTFSRIG
jgi:hypothetical protein